MKNYEGIKAALLKAVEENLSAVAALSDDLAAKPELSGEEYETSRKLVELLRQKGFQVEYPYAGLDTAFRGVCGPDNHTYKVAVLAEYAPQVAAREEHRAAAACAGNARFLAEVRCGPRHDRRVRHGTKAELSACAVDAAAARTDGAKLCHNASRAWDLARNQWILWIL